MDMGSWKVECLLQNITSDLPRSHFQLKLHVQSREAPSEHHWMFIGSSQHTTHYIHLHIFL